MSWIASRLTDVVRSSATTLVIDVVISSALGQVRCGDGLMVSLIMRF